MTLPIFAEQIKMARISKTTKITQIPPQKSIWTTYLLWLFGGIFGLHHFYLGRDRQAFIWWATLGIYEYMQIDFFTCIKYQSVFQIAGGYFGVGWIVDFFKIPEMVRDANEDPEFISKFKDKLREHRKPPFSMIRFSGAFMVAYLFGQMIMIAIPEHDFGGINWSFLHWLIPFGVSLGIWFFSFIHAAFIWTDFYNIFPHFHRNLDRWQYRSRTWFIIAMSSGRVYCISHSIFCVR